MAEMSDVGSPCPGCGHNPHPAACEIGECSCPSRVLGSVFTCMNCSHPSHGDVRCPWENRAGDNKCVCATSEYLIIDPRPALPTKPQGGIFDISKGQCEAAAILRGEHIQCELAVVHDGWAHQSIYHELMWQAAPLTPKINIHGHTLRGENIVSGGGRAAFNIHSSPDTPRGAGAAGVSIPEGPQIINPQAYGQRGPE